jgi:hypothetical protein
LRLCPIVKSPPFFLETLSNDSIFLPAIQSVSRRHEFESLEKKHKGDHYLVYVYKKPIGVILNLFQDLSVRRH